MKFYVQMHEFFAFQISQFFMLNSSLHAIAHMRDIQSHCRFLLHRCDQIKWRDCVYSQKCRQCYFSRLQLKNFFSRSHLFHFKLPVYRVECAQFKLRFYINYNSFPKWKVLLLHSLPLWIFILFLSLKNWKSFAALFFSPPFRIAVGFVSSSKENCNWIKNELSVLRSYCILLCYRSFWPTNTSAAATTN
jgi:hypothetical protein